MDTLTFGARRFLRHLTDLGYKKSPVTEFDVSKVSSHILSFLFFSVLVIFVMVF
jgi:hypothetical protein